MRVPFMIAGALVALVLARRWKKTGFETKALAVVLATGLIVYGSGVVEFPDVEKAIEDLGESLGKWTYAFVALMAFLETGAFVGLVAPGEFSVILGGVIAGQGEINIIILIGLVWACAIAGDSVSFYLGQRLGRGFLEKHGPRVKITEARLVQVEKFFEKHGGATILIGRFIGLVRALAPFIAGASKMPYKRFLPYDVIGAGIWASFFCVLGYVFWQSFDKVANIAGKGAFALGTVITIVVGSVALYRWLKIEGNPEKVTAFIDERRSQPGWKQLFAVALPFYRRVVVPLQRWLRGPVKFFWDRLTPGELGLELTALLSIAMVGGFTFGGLSSLVEEREDFQSDDWAFDVSDDLRNDTVIDLAKALTHLGDLALVGPFVLIAVVFLLARREVVEGITIAAGFILTYAGVHITKGATDRPRPFDRLVETDGSSFPSGHAAYAFALIAVAIAFRHAMPGLFRKSIAVIVALIIVLIVGASRVYLRAHYLTDVLAGYGLAAACFSVCALVGLFVAFVRQDAKARADGSRA